MHQPAARSVSAVPSNAEAAHIAARQLRLFATAPSRSSTRHSDPVLFGCITALVTSLVLCVVSGGVCQGQALPEAQAAAEVTDDDWSFTPTLSTEVGQLDEVLRFVPDSGPTVEEPRSLWHTRLALGLDLALPSAWLAPGRLELRTELGVGLVYQRGHWPVFLRETLVWSLPLGLDWLSLTAGTGVGVHVNASDPAFSMLELAFPVGLRIAFVDLAWHPALTVGLGGDEDAVFGGELRHDVGTRFAPLNFAARFRIDALTF